MSTDDDTDVVLVGNHTHFDTNGTAFVVATLIGRYIPPFYLIMGTFGNLIAITVLQRKHLRQHVSTFYFSAIFWVDTAILQIVVWPLIIETFTKVYMVESSLWNCRVHAFVFNVAIDIAHWTLCACSIERMVAFTSPCGALKWTKARAWLSILLITIAALVINFPALYVHHLLVSSEITIIPGTNCVPHVDVIHASLQPYYSTWMYIKFILNILAPCIIIFVCNITISWEMHDKRSNCLPNQDNASTARVLLALFVTTFLLTSPQSVLDLMLFCTDFTTDQKAIATWRIVYILAYVLALSTCSCKFLIFRCLSPKFQTHFNDLYCGDSKVIARTSRHSSSQLIHYAPMNGDVRHETIIISQASSEGRIDRV